jgi:hypothetical protein
VGAALTKPGRASTARWFGSGKRDGEEYARNRRRYVPQCFTGSNLADVGRARCVPTLEVGNFADGLTLLPVKATRKVCGVLVAIPQGHSRAPTSTSESQ